VVLSLAQGQLYFYLTIEDQEEDGRLMDLGGLYYMEG
jgi:hypothetical protein